MQRWVFDFEEGSRALSHRLGGKGANIAEMSRVLGPERVPAGFTVATDACSAYMRAERREPEGFAADVDAALVRLEHKTGRRLGDAVNPLLVSVRSGARVSMPGMLDTVLNLGLDDASVDGLAARCGDTRFAWDCYRRFVQAFATVVLGLSPALFESALRDARERCEVGADAELPVKELIHLVHVFKLEAWRRSGTPFPRTPHAQLVLAIRAVFDSWTGQRAVTYRRLNGIPDEWGTAVNVQEMVFGNLGDHSATGVAFSRDEITGSPHPSGDFLIRAQGEDVVSGMRNTRPLIELADVMPVAYRELLTVLRTLERHFGDMQDVEFTIEDGHLYLLQTRAAKRPAQAAVRFACDAVDEGLLSPRAALATIDARALDALLHPSIDPRAAVAPIAAGVAASPGAATGEIVLSVDDAVIAARAGRAVVLVRPFTQAEDVAGFHAAVAIVTAEGGKASHAALVARGMGRPAVVGVRSLALDAAKDRMRFDENVLRAGDVVTVDGTTGCIFRGALPLVEAHVDERFDRVLAWADEIRRLGVRANADTPDEALTARRLGAEGIGLCRTEHMFMAPDRQPKMRSMILAETELERREALQQLLPLQQADFEGLFRAMAGSPVTIRLLDPPLHEFLPQAEDIVRELEGAHHQTQAERRRLERLLARVRELAEINPMLGTRGCRLALLHPEIYEMQVEAIARAATALRRPPHLEIMIPLVAYDAELARMRALVVRVASRHGLVEAQDYTVGTMLELPRACFVADRIAEHADFFSFGTNDLTQTVIGLSRDDAEGRFLTRYLEEGLIDRSPFETIDGPGVGWLVRLGAWVGRERRPSLGLGVCGEHGGDPGSIAFFHQAGLDYVSCSPYRLPIARVAAAQAAIADDLLE